MTANRCQKMISFRPMATNEKSFFFFHRRTKKMPRLSGVFLGYKASEDQKTHRREEK
jgi:hypothetical protein